MGGVVDRRGQQLTCSIALAVNVVVSYVFVVLTPSLIARHVILLEALTGGITTILTGGAYARVGRASLWAVALSPVFGILLTTVLYWWAGRLWGERALRSYSHTPRRRTSSSAHAMRRARRGSRE